MRGVEEVPEVMLDAVRFVELAGEEVLVLAPQEIEEETALALDAAQKIRE